MRFVPEYSTVTNITERKFQKGDIVRCRVANFTPEQVSVTPNRPVLNGLYIVRAALANTTSSTIHQQVLLLEGVQNKVYRAIYEGREYLTENGFNPVRFESIIAAEETDWAVAQTLLTLSQT